tara:strand:- start:418 stop:1065 length:648 start_codon:yes stop_codon:yes gene_type:complete
MGCSKKTAIYAKCSIPGTWWVYGYGQYAKSVKDITIYSGTPQKGYKPAKPFWDISLPNFKKKIDEAKTHIKDAGARKLLDLAGKSLTVPAYYIYVEHPALKNSRIVVEWFYDRELRDLWFKATEKALKENTDTLRVSFVRNLKTKPPKTTSVSALLKSLASSAKKAVKAGATAEVIKNLPKIPPHTSAEVGLGVWPYVVGVALFGAVVMLLYKKK